MTKPVLHGVRIDIESRSSTDIKSGVYKYTEDPDFKVLVLCYAPLRRFPGGAVVPGKPRELNLWDRPMVEQFKRILADPTMEKHAYNAAFERISLSRWMGMGDGTYLDPVNWHCSAIRANVSGVYGSLDDVAKAVRSPIKKDAEGKRLIRLFSIPDKKTGKFHEPRSHQPEGVSFKLPGCWCGVQHRDDFDKFVAYCNNDVMTEMVVAKQFPDLPESVQAQYEADQRINDRGIRHFRTLAERAVDGVTAEQARLMGELQALTGLANPNSNQQMQGWLEEQGYPMTSLAKAFRDEALADPFIPDAVAEALTLKGAASLTSVSKHKAALKTRCRDGRIRGSLQFYGAHTGREAGRGIQPQNLPRYEAPDADRRLLIKGLAGPEAPRIAKGTVRASLVPAKDHVFVVFDYNAIEARCLGWECGEDWVLDEFRTGPGKIYEATAAIMFGVDKDAMIKALKICDKCGACADCAVRGKGKVSELALGYAGGAGALVTMGAAKEGIDVGNYPELNAEWKAAGMPGKFFDYEKDRQDWPELERLKTLYRDARPATVRFWKLCAKAWDLACEGKTVRFGDNQILTMMRDGPHNRLVLPSGRSIWYRYAKAHHDPDRPERIDRRTFIGKGKGVGHMRTDTHGGKLTENITQAIARDALFDLIMKIEAETAKGWPGRLVLHVHDEVVVEVHKNHADQVKADLEGWMNETPVWAPGLPLKGVGDIMERYKK